MQNTLNKDQMRALAFAMYSYFGERHPTRLGLKVAYAEENRGSERNFERKMENEGAKLSEEECDWVVSNLLRNIDTLPLRKLFHRTVGDSPESFGYEVPTYEVLPFDKETSTPDPVSKFDRWQKKKLLNKEPETV
ncbi:hypothetical protein [Runella slithyformis]|uniref:Uncharacterized protein n=1 Tax=Runella slithyformis (strain ATCC 29530 / DSM 19594 / LMG 11500 / NCIMB 11436 / LSU 4) TaxID=761193 RepID=A0A7U3ZI40_RUNSL|nr:hypothetical protein [Runella slithyformis]AEI47637.1 hypothetical protein Runsl_1209 [Runella slithyformis DSM 19594]